MEFFHVLNRGVDKRAIVIDDRDRVRFMHDLFAFNDADLVLHMRQPARHSEEQSKQRSWRARKLLVHIHAFCLMDNHYHLLLTEARDNGIPLFMQKLNMGYTKYFNEKYERVGTLWQSKYKSLRIARDAHFIYIPYYVHLNPLDYKHPEWREGKVVNPDHALKYLRTYRWSSHLDYLGIPNFPSITSRSEISSQLGKPAHYEREIRDIITSRLLAGSSVAIEQ